MSRASVLEGNLLNSMKPTRGLDLSSSVDFDGEDGICSADDAAAAATSSVMVLVGCGSAVLICSVLCPSDFGWFSGDEASSAGFDEGVSSLEGTLGGSCGGDGVLASCCCGVSCGCADSCCLGSGC